MSTTTSDQGLILPVDGDPMDSSKFFADYNSGVENRLLKRYESAVDRSVRDPAPNKGEITYLADTDTHERYDGSGWKNLRGGTDHTFLPGETGSLNVSFTTQNSFTFAIGFNTPFVVAPAVMVNLTTSAGAAIGWIARAFNVTTTGFTLYLHHAAGTNATFSAQPVDWVAIGRQ